LIAHTFFDEFYHQPALQYQHVLKTNFREPYRQDDSSYEVASDYAVIEPLAQGEMGQVMVAWDHDLKRRVALKEIHPKNTDDPRYQLQRTPFLQVATGGWW
jgi:serine/threonine protein kinase